MKRTPMKRRPKRISADERKYAAWIRQQLCAACGVWIFGGIEFAHTGGLKGGSGMGLKSNWRLGIPLCSYCHRGDNGYHGPHSEQEWCELHGIDLPAVRADLWERYKVETGVNLVDG